MDDRDLELFIAEHNIVAEIIHMSSETPTVSKAAAALGVSPEQIGKTILFLADDRPLLVIANGPARINYRRLANGLGLSRKRLRLASAEQVLDITGFSIGSVPPFGHTQLIRTVLSMSVTVLPEIFVGGGADNALMRIETSELRRVTQSIVLPI